MERTVAMGIQNFSELIERNYFYVDKTLFIKEWWESGDNTTLITRPRRFGKTLNMSMLETFFSLEFADRKDLFQGLAIWEYEKYRQLQGTYPVISLSFAGIKDTTLSAAKKRMYGIIKGAFVKNNFLMETDILSAAEKVYFESILSGNADDVDVTSALYQLSDYLCRYYGKRVIILLDEYDTPMQEAYVCDYWQEMVAFTRTLFNATFKTNPYLERAIMTGITRVSKESIFSDLNHLKIVTTTSDEYATAFGFTEEEVFAALDEYGLSQKREEVKCWYDGFIFGKSKDIYNPWSIINYLQVKDTDAYWANTSTNSLIGKLLQEGTRDVKEKFEILLKEGSIKTQIDEQIVYNQLDNNETAIWSLFVACGYLKVLNVERFGKYGKEKVYELAITNLETMLMFEKLVSDWFGGVTSSYNGFIKALLNADLNAMNAYMNHVSLNCFSYFDTGKGVLGVEPERFYHGFVLGLLVELQNDYMVTSNRESGFGRYDVTIEPRDIVKGDAIILEFKVHDAKSESSLEETVAVALKQIEDKQYAAQLEERGFAKERIRKYGVAFQGKNVLIG